MTKNVAHLFATIDNALCRLSASDRREAWNILTALRGPDLRRLQTYFKEETTGIIRAIALPRFMTKVADSNGSGFLAVVTRVEAIRNPQLLHAVTEAVQARTFVQREDVGSEHPAHINEEGHIRNHLLSAVAACLRTQVDVTQTMVRVNCWLPDVVTGGANTDGAAVRVLAPIDSPERAAQKDGDQ